MALRNIDVASSSQEGSPRPELKIVSGTEGQTAAQGKGLFDRARGMVKESKVHGFFEGLKNGKVREMLDKAKSDKAEHDWVVANGRRTPDGPHREPPAGISIGELPVTPTAEQSAAPNTEVPLPPPAAKEDAAAPGPARETETATPTSGENPRLGDTAPALTRVHLPMGEQETATFIAKAGETPPVASQATEQPESSSEEPSESSETTPREKMPWENTTQGEIGKIPQLTSKYEAQLADLMKPGQLFTEQRIGETIASAVQDRDLSAADAQAILNRLDRRYGSAPGSLSSDISPTDLQALRAKAAEGKPAASTTESTSATSSASETQTQASGTQTEEKTDEPIVAAKGEGGTKIDNPVDTGVPSADGKVEPKTESAVKFVDAKYAGRGESKTEAQSINNGEIQAAAPAEAQVADTQAAQAETASQPEQNLSPEQQLTALRQENVALKQQVAEAERILNDPVLLAREIPRAMDRQVENRINQVFDGINRRWENGKAYLREQKEKIGNALKGIKDALNEKRRRIADRVKDVAGGVPNAFGGLEILAGNVQKLEANAKLMLIEMAFNSANRLYEQGDNHVQRGKDRREAVKNAREGRRLIKTGENPDAGETAA